MLNTARGCSLRARNPKSGFSTLANDFTSWNRTPSERTANDPGEALREFVTDDVMRGLGFGAPPGGEELPDVHAAITTVPIATQYPRPMTRQSSSRERFGPPYRHFTPAIERNPIAPRTPNHKICPAA